ncbi:MAG: hypothetical protein ABIH21_03050 [Patescibacteria group bacterium]
MSPFSQTMFGATKNVRSFSDVLMKKSFVLNIVTLGLVLVFCSAYIVQVNGTAAKGYKIRELETKINELSIANQQLEIKTQNSQSVQTIAKAVKMIGMVGADTPKYVAGAQPSLALAEDR